MEHMYHRSLKLYNTCNIYILPRHWMSEKACASTSTNYIKSLVLNMFAGLPQGLRVSIIHFTTN